MCTCVSDLTSYDLFAIKKWKWVFHFVADIIVNYFTSNKPETEEDFFCLKSRLNSCYHAIGIVILPLSHLRIMLTEVYYSIGYKELGAIAAGWTYIKRFLIPMAHSTHQPSRSHGFVLYKTDNNSSICFRLHVTAHTTIIL